MKYKNSKTSLLVYLFHTGKMKMKLTSEKQHCRVFFFKLWMNKLPPSVLCNFVTCPLRALSVNFPECQILKGSGLSKFAEKSNINRHRAVFHIFNRILYDISCRMVGLNWSMKNVLLWGNPAQHLHGRQTDKTFPCHLNNINVKVK